MVGSRVSASTVSPPYRLVRLLGQGGMGQVWEARHLVAGTAVAIKLLAGHRPWTEQMITHLRFEAMTIARLAHPNIIRLLDLSMAPAGAFGGLVGQAGPAPLLVMELAESGNLDGWVGRLSWSSVHRVITQLLLALAHAHAQSVLHCDIKPSNLLLSSEGTLILSDFGLSALAGGKRVGTPGYLSPEQHDGDSAEYGPWTDLYGVGCTIYRLLTGATFTGVVHERFVEQAGSDVPPAVWPWLRWLTTREPMARPAHARSALDVLTDQIGAAPEGAIGLPVSRYPRGLEGDCADGTEPPLAGGSGSEVSDTQSRWSWAVTGGPGVQEAPLPPPSVVVLNLEDESSGERDVASPTRTGGGSYLLRSDRYETSSRAPTGGGPREEETGAPASPIEGQNRNPLAVAGMGDGLLGWRLAPLIGREHEKQALLSSLEAWRRGVGPRVVRILGTSGIGKSRLAGWLHAEVHERAWAEHVGPLDLRSLTDTPPATWRRLLQLHQRFGSALVLPREDLLAWRRRMGAPLAGQSAPVSGAPPTGSEMESICEVLAWSAKEAPVVVWLEVANPPSREALAFLRVMSEVPGRLLLLLEVHGTGSWTEAVPLPGMELKLGGLDPWAMSAVLEWFVMLEPAVLAELVTSAQGNPGYAIELLHGCQEQGLLRHSADGFHTAELLDVDFSEATKTRWDTILSALGGIDPSIELAAVLGPGCQLSTWREVAEVLGVECSVAAVDALDRVGLVTLVKPDTEVEFSFVQPHFRAALLRHSAREGRYEALRERCIGALRPRTDRWSRARCGVLLYESGALHQAADLLFWTSSAIAPDDLGTALRLLRLAERALVEAGEGEGARPRVRIWALQSVFAQMANEPRRADALSRRVLDAAPPDQWHLELAIAHVTCCRLALGIDKEKSLAHARLATRHAQRCESLHVLQHAECDLARALLKAGELDAARRQFQRVMILGPEGQRIGSMVWFHLAELELVAFDLQAALEAARRAKGVNERLGHTWNQVLSLIYLVVAHRMGGELQDARRALEEARRLNVDPRLQAWHIEKEASLLAVEEGHVRQARENLGRVLAVESAGLSSPMKLTLCGCMVRIAADLGRWEEARQCLLDVERMLDQMTGESVGYEAPYQLLKAGDRALSAGAFGLAGAAYALCLRLATTNGGELIQQRAREGMTRALREDG